MRSRTRSEILMAMTAALLFAAVMGWRFATVYRSVPWLGLGAMLAWVLVSLIWFRDRIWPPPPSAIPAVDHYRRELERRRDHLRNEWIWHGPLLAACLTLAAVLNSSMAMRDLRSLAPIVVVLVVWTVYGIVRRRRQAA